MELFKYELLDKINLPEVLKSDLNNENFCFLDIETTGLSSKYHKIILIGMLCVEDDNVYIVQFFANHPDKEKALLEQFNQYLNKFKCMLTFNGLTFDIPFIKKRFGLYDMKSDIGNIEHLDILRTVRKHKTLLGLDNCKLKTVEKSLGIYREDTISGKESVDLYNKYALSSDKDFNIRDIILKHNYDDIFYLPKLLSIYDIVDKKNNLKLDLLYKEIKCVVNISKDSISFKKNKLYLEGYSSSVNIPYQLYYEEDYVLDWDTNEGFLKFEINYRNGTISSGENCLYLDLSSIFNNLFKSNKLGYSIPDNILLLKVNDDVVYENIELLIKEVLCNIE